ncbi:hypothetical protein HanPI659440_Chr09g0341501 [Helianthus annuus]|nr:hypothetical protein HanPI659440_Chr09g0341501 [Helianthus annuus]
MFICFMFSFALFVTLIFIRFLLIFIHILFTRFMFMLIHKCIFILKLMLILSFILMIHTFVPVRERNPRDLLAWVPYIPKHGLAYILHSYTYMFLLFHIYEYPDSYTISTSYADYATINIIAGAHEITVIGV